MVTGPKPVSRPDTTYSTSVSLVHHAKHFIGSDDSTDRNVDQRSKVVAAPGLRTVLLPFFVPLRSPQQIAAWSSVTSRCSPKRGGFSATSQLLYKFCLLNASAFEPPSISRGARFTRPGSLEVRRDSLTKSGRQRLNHVDFWAGRLPNPPWKLTSPLHNSVVREDSPCYCCILLRVFSNLSQAGLSPQHPR